MSEFARKESQKAYPNQNWKEPDLSKVTKAWYQREFTVPADWTGRRMALTIRPPNPLATVFVDGPRLGKRDFPRR